MKSILFTAILLLFGLPAFAQTQTQTNCTANGDQINCTSTDNSAANAAAAQQQKDIDESMNKMGNAIGTAIGNKILKKRVSKWCVEHPDGSWNFPNGQNVTCFNWNEAYQPQANAQLRAQREEQEITAVVAAHMFCEAHPDQTWTSTFNGKVMGCGQRIALDDAACSRNPSYSWCKAIADAQAHAPVAQSAPLSASVTAPSPAASASTAPTAPAPAPVSSAPPAPVTAASTPAPPQTQEQKDAASYCQRNPTATITWNDGKVSPCASVLGAR